LHIRQVPQSLLRTTMDVFLQIDWRSIFLPSVSVAEIFLRGTIVYLFLFFILRMLRREAGAIGISDLLLVVLIADAAQNAMSSDYKSVTDGLILVGTIAFWDYFLDWMGYRFPSVRRLLRPSPLLLIKNGRMQRRNMRREMITEDELMGQLRERGIERMEEVKKAYLEGDGRISVITRDSMRDSKGAEAEGPERSIP
jgi:uncharacterized membrane protein YcaP (DUF421 family)